jgi:hypothetical protein
MNSKVQRVKHLPLELHYFELTFPDFPLTLLNNLVVCINCTGYIISFQLQSTAVSSKLTRQGPKSHWLSCKQCSTAIFFENIENFSKYNNCNDTQHVISKNETRKLLHGHCLLQHLAKQTGRLGTIYSLSSSSSSSSLLI